MDDSTLDTPRPYSTLVPTLSPAFISADDAAVYAHDLIGNQREEEFGGFILSKDHQYFATIPQSSEGTLFRPADVLSLGENGDILPPEGYAIEGLYHSHTVFAHPLNLSDEERALQDNFFSMMDLRTAISFRHNYGRFYLSNPDGSLLCYVSSDSQLERALMPVFRLVHPGPPGHLEQSDAENVLLPSDFLAMVYLAGELSVVCPGTFWRRRARITGDWRTGQVIDTQVDDRPPLCGPIAATANAAARLAHAQMLKGARVQRVGFILKHTEHARFVCTRPHIAAFERYDRPDAYGRERSGAPLLPAGYQVVAVYHSADNAGVPVPASQRLLMNNCFSPDNVCMGFWLMQNAIGHKIYFSAPQGALLSYRQLSEGIDRALIASVTRREGEVSDFEHLLSLGVLSAADYVRHVAQGAVLEVLVTDTVWTRKGRVTERWQPFVVLTEQGQDPSA